jgi:hypothetical protein
MYTGRDNVHAYLMKNAPPVDLNGAALYHCGPVMLQEGGEWKVKAAGPTTSSGTSTGSGSGGDCTCDGFCQSSCAGTPLCAQHLLGGTRSLSLSLCRTSMSNQS